MSDFERAWQGKLRAGLVKLGRPELFEASGPCPDDAPPEERVAWNGRLQALLQAALSPAKRAELLTGCACRYPPEELAFLRELYRESGNLARTHEALQAFFLTMISEYKQLDDEHLAFIQENDMGMAGRLEGRTITAVKIPKELKAYLAADEPDERARLYCHCPRIRDALEAARETLPADYCLCSAGFYRFLWEEILEAPVEVSVTRTLLAGDPICEFRIVLPQLPAP
ncbi:MAG: hypothetical protein P1V51_12625 [Deltaproteobacteria bacterium]|nr:hypothetical protein [Deltaproteobacteria bacterium]